jgi:hypothetical protein
VRRLRRWRSPRDAGRIAASSVDAPSRFGRPHALRWLSLCQWRAQDFSDLREKCPSISVF